MDVKEAVAISKAYIVDLFEHESITNVGLEEVDFDSSKNVWYVTIGFSRPWDEPRNTLAALAAPGPYKKRSYKTLRVSNEDGTVLSIKNRELTS